MGPLSQNVELREETYMGGILEMRAFNFSFQINLNGVRGSGGMSRFRIEVAH